MYLYTANMINTGGRKSDQNTLFDFLRVVWGCFCSLCDTVIETSVSRTTC